MNTTNMKDLRIQNKLSQTEIAQKIGTSQSNYGKMENGEIEANIEKLIKLADYYDVSLDYLVGRQYANEVGYLTPDQKEFIKLFLKLDEFKQSKVAGYVTGMLERE